MTSPIVILKQKINLEDFRSYLPEFVQHQFWQPHNGPMSQQSNQHPEADFKLQSSTLEF
jgi:hypothetical protein